MSSWTALDPVVGLRKVFEDGVDRGVGARLVRPCEDQKEFVTTDARRETGAARAVSQTPRNFGNDTVADGMAMSIVDLAHAIDVHQEHQQRRGRRMSADHCDEPLLRVHASDQGRQRVDGEVRFVACASGRIQGRGLRRIRSIGHIACMQHEAGQPRDIEAIVRMAGENAETAVARDDVKAIVFTGAWFIHVMTTNGLPTQPAFGLRAMSRLEHAGEIPADQRPDREAERAVDRRTDVGDPSLAIDDEGQVALMLGQRAVIVLEVAQRAVQGAIGRDVAHLPDGADDIVAVWRERPHEQFAEEAGAVEPDQRVLDDRMCGDRLVVARSGETLAQHPLEALRDLHAGEESRLRSAFDRAGSRVVARIIGRPPRRHREQDAPRRIHGPDASFTNDGDRGGGMREHRLATAPTNGSIELRR